MTSSTTSGFYVGDDTNSEKYRLVRQVGSGGEATLWLGYLVVGGSEEKVAVKILRPEHDDDFDRLQERWADQVETLRFISDPGIVAVRDWFVGPLMHRRGEEPPSRRRALYLAMNWVDGESFRDWVAIHEGPAAWVDALSKLAQVARALDDLHAGRAIPSGRSVTHGDISPGNVMITPEEQAIIVDFGLVRLADHHTARAMGTPGFAAPEVWTQGHYSPAADRYSFAALGYFALFGEAPPTDVRMIHQFLFSHPRLRNAPPPRVAAVMSGFDPDPERRPTATAWLEALRDGATTSSRNTFVPHGPSVVTQPPPHDTTYPRRAVGAAPASAPARTSRGLVVGIGAGAVVLVLMFAVAISVIATRGSDTGGAGSTGTQALPTTTTAVTLPAPVSTVASGPINVAPVAAPTFTGSVRLTEDGTGVDNGEPVSNVYNDVTWRAGNTLDAGTTTAAARWPSAGDPSLAQCTEQMARQAYSSAEKTQIPFESGLGLCVELSGRNSGRFVMFLRMPDSAAQPAIQADATIWRKPSS